MKNILFYTFLFSFFLMGCQSEELDVYPVNELTDEASSFETMLLNKTSTTLTLPKSGPGQTVDLGVQVAFAGAPQSGAISYTYEIVETSADIANLDATLTGAIESGKTTGVLPLKVSLDDYVVGEENTISLKLTASGANFTDGTTIAYSFYVVCPSDLSGEYNSVTTGLSTDTCCPDEVTTESSVTLVDEGDGNYTVSDFSAGLYFTWYGVYGITEAHQTDGTLSGGLIDICNEISGTFTEPFDTDTVVTGSVDAATGVITYSWVNGYGDAATVVLTPQ